MIAMQPKFAVILPMSFLFADARSGDVFIDTRYKWG
jgi:hypothetical protein